MKLETLECKVEEIRREQQEARLRKNVANTATPQTTINFSPGSQNNTPSKSRGESPRKRPNSDM